MLSFAGLLTPIITSAGAACGGDPPLPSEGLAWPLSGSVTNSWSLDCLTDGGHRGIDIGATAGTPVMASAGGTVIYSGYTPAEGGGATISIEHAGGLRSTYLHLEAVDVVTGQQVNQGQILALTNGSPLHFGLKLLAEPRELYFNPVQFLTIPAAADTPDNTATSPVDPVTGVESTTPEITVPAADMPEAAVNSVTMPAAPIAVRMTPSHSLESTPGLGYPGSAAAAAGESFSGLSVPDISIPRGSNAVDGKHEYWHSPTVAAGTITAGRHSGGKTFSMPWRSLALIVSLAMVLAVIKALGRRVQQAPLPEVATDVYLGTASC